MGRRRDPQVDPTTKPPSGYLESPLQCAIFALNRKRQGQQQQKILHCTTQERTSTTALSTFPYRSMKSRQTVLPRHHTSSVNGCPARFALEFDACRAYRAKCKRGIIRLVSYVITTQVGWARVHETTPPMAGCSFAGVLPPYKPLPHTQCWRHCPEGLFQQAHLLGSVWGVERSGGGARLQGTGGRGWLPLQPLVQITLTHSLLTLWSSL